MGISVSVFQVSALTFSDPSAARSYTVMYFPLSVKLGIPG
ncbi:MAG: hypothetical protein H6Q32_1422, partial [Bacteroidetes bacterium]|nr:hypothetical protein [Bacteroidota bacterium]